MNINTQQHEKAKIYFEPAIEYSPESTHAYDSMADNYQTAGDFTQVLKYVTKAFEISGDNCYGRRIEELQFN